ncbi:cation channel sperm-associated protein 4 [Callorhinchus milii]|uniref:cation channel sperm-associated protein 4 n=1 Tax=Callorhinchus milii TaxID=7868 RepID=UPI001C3FDE35|nr:cation channel sperm-associated protein 4 [Callorhinchus milii]
MTFKGQATLRRFTTILNPVQKRRSSIPKEEVYFKFKKFKDEWEAEEYITQVMLHSLLDHVFLRTLAVGLLIGTSIVISFQTEPSFSEKYSLIFTMFEQIVTTIFFWEILLKWYYGFWIFWTEGWNIIDFLVTFILFVGPLFIKDHQLFYVLRLFRMVKSFVAIKGLAVIVHVILQSISDMANIILLIILISLVFAVFGVILFSTSVPNSFGSLQEAMYSLFICITQDGWVQIYQGFIANGGLIMYGGALYLFIFIIGASFIFANIMIAVVTANLEQAISEEEEKRHLIQRGSGYMAQMKDDTESSPELDLVNIDNCIRHMGTGNKKGPMKYSAMENLNQGTFEEFCFVLQSMQQNLLVYSRIRKELDSIYLEVSEMEVNRDQQTLVKQEKKMLDIMETLAGRKVDLLNTLFPLEKMSQMINTGSLKMDKNESDENSAKHSAVHRPQ